MYNPKSKVAASISIWDIAGLVKGASQGEGLGNAFLSHINSVDGIFHVVRAFKNDDVIHQEGEVDPVRDMEIINDEIYAKDLQHLEKAMEEVDKVIKRSNSKPAKEEKEVLLKV